MRTNKWIPLSRKSGETLRLRSGQAWGIPFRLLFAIYFCSARLIAQTQVPVSYDLKVGIEPKQGSVQVEGTIDVPLSDAGAKRLSFGLHETFAVEKLLINGQAASFRYDTIEPTPLNPATRNVVVNLPQGIPAGKVHVEIKYAGRLQKLPEFGANPNAKFALDDQINPRLVELANYSSWYPQFVVMGSPIESKLEVSLPKGWIAICSGRKIEEQVKGERAVTRWASTKDMDILITASPNYKKKLISLPGGQVEIYSTQLPQAFVDREGAEIVSIMNVFSQNFGESSVGNATVKHVFSPKRKGQGRAGIARPGMIVTSEGLVLEQLRQNPDFSLFQDVAHEIAHFWWNFGVGQGDWINEAFTEYSSALAVKQVRSERDFDKVLQGYRDAVVELPPEAPSLANVPFDGSGFVVRYYKGSLMLEAFRQTLGDNQFYAATREFFETYKGRGIGTEEFRSFWKEKLQDRKEMVDWWLDSAGGGPGDNKSSRN